MDLRTPPLRPQRIDPFYFPTLICPPPPYVPLNAIQTDATKIRPILPTPRIHGFIFRFQRVSGTFVCPHQFR